MVCSLNDHGGLLVGFLPDLQTIGIANSDKISLTSCRRQFRLIGDPHAELVLNLLPVSENKSLSLSVNCHNTIGLDMRSLIDHRRSAKFLDIPHASKQVPVWRYYFPLRHPERWLPPVLSVAKLLQLHPSILVRNLLLPYILEDH